MLLVDKRNTWERLDRFGLFFFFNICNSSNWVLRNEKLENFRKTERTFSMGFLNEFTTICVDWSNYFFLFVMVLKKFSAKEKSANSDKLQKTIIFVYTLDHNWGYRNDVLVKFFFCFICYALGKVFSEKQFRNSKFSKFNRFKRLKGGKN